MDILVNVANQKLKIATNLKSLVAGTQEFVRFVFNTSGDWDGLATFAQFRQNGVAYNQYLDDDKAAYLPSEIGVGTCTVMLYGSNGNTIATTNYLTLTIDENILVSDAQSTDISLSLYNQLVSKVNSLSTWNEQNTSLYGGLIEISPDGQPITPDLVLSYRGGTKQGIIHNVQSLTNANALVETAEISFDVYKEIDGVECQLWDDIRDFRLVYIPHLDTSTFNPWYELSVEVDENDCTIKHCQGIHLQEAELGQLTLNGVEINTEDDIARDDYSPTIIYDPKNPEASALDRILKDKASHYTIVHVDSSIANLQRTFSWDGSSIKDAFDDIANEVECLFKYGEYTNNDGKIHRTISVYDLNDRCMECGERGSFTTKVCPKCGSANINYGYGTDSGIFLSHENFAGDITYSSNKDSVKNCFRLVAGDDLMTATIRNINPSGSQYIWYLSDSVRADMSQALQDKLKAYDTEYESYSTEKQIDIPSTVISEYNALINKYKLYDDTLTNVKYPIVGYSALTDVYYSALNFYSLLKTTLAPASEHGEKTTAAKELAKLTTNTLSPLGIQNAEISSSATVTSAVQNYAKV